VYQQRTGRSRRRTGNRLQGGELEIGFNINYLLDVLTNLPADTLQMAFGDANRSTLVTIPDYSNFKYIVMPMRI
jgi:DNA polymerase-3 subunit beta